MNICLLSDKYPPDPGGLAISTQRLARGLVTAGQTVHVCVPTPDHAPGQVTRSTENGLTVHRFGLFKRVDETQAYWFEQIAGLHRRLGLDLLHGYYLVGAGFVTVYAGRYLNLLAVISARGNDLDRAAFNPGRLSAILWALANADAVTAVSRDLARRACALAPASRVQVIPNGVDTRHFAPVPPDLKLKARSGLPAQAPLVGFVGEARLKKGLTLLLPAFAQAVETAARTGRPRPALLLVGDIRAGDADIWRVFKAQNPHLKLYHVPQVEPERLPQFYNLIDVLALPSLQDGLPNALLEGMACARAIVASNVGGIPDALRHDENGLLVPPGDAGALAQALDQLLAAPLERRQALGQAARQTVMRDFSPETELAKNLELYRHLSHRSTTLDKPAADVPEPPAR
jgi:phosphatidylinositol alpha-1,6-mannosyltransferase